MSKKQDRDFKDLDEFQRKLEEFIDKYLILVVPYSAKEASWKLKRDIYNKELVRIVESMARRKRRHINDPDINKNYYLKSRCIF